MNKMLETLYFQSPIWLQNALVSLYGVRLRNRRSGRAHNLFFDHLCETTRYSAIQIQDYQNQEFLKLVKHVFAHVPFYRRYTDDVGVSFGDIKSLADISKLPIIEKDMLRENPHDFCSDSYLGGKKFALTTSGTTGKPLAIYCDAISRQRHYAFWARLREMNGIVKGMKRATFFGRVIQRADDIKPPFWRYDYVNRNLLCSSYHLSDDCLYAYCEKLVKYGPDEIIGYPSSLYRLAQFINKKGGFSIFPRVVFTTAETLLKNQREEIEQAFGTKVVDQYGSTEMVHFAAQCNEGLYHIHPEHGYCEVLDGVGRPVSCGEIGEFVCTGFVNYAMPLIRYRLGDCIAISSNNQCACGSAFPIISDIQGRSDDVVYNVNRIPVGRFSPWKNIEGILQAQMVQADWDEVFLRIVLSSKENGKRVKKKLEDKVRQTLGSRMKIKVEFVDFIKKEKNGKHKLFISHLNVNGNSYEY